MATATVLETRVEWETKLLDALDRAKVAGKHVLLDFFNPG